MLVRDSKAVANDCIPLEDKLEQYEISIIRSVWIDETQLQNDAITESLVIIPLIYIDFNWGVGMELNILIHISEGIS